MKQDSAMRIREIPYNYTSFSDREIILRFLGKAGWGIIESLRTERRTGRSARMLFEVLGDMWVIQRNPFIQDDLLQNKARRDALIGAIYHRLQQIRNRADNNQRALDLLALAETAVERFEQDLIQQGQWRKQLKKALKPHTASDNINFDGLSRVSHATDATDWRVEMPLAVLTPDTEAELGYLVNACIELGFPIIPRGGGTGYTGSAVPLHANSIVLNTEKLNHVTPVKKQSLVGVDTAVPCIRAEAGAVTVELSKMAAKSGYIFAVDPTSQDASTIGGNIAMNAGGKKAVLWGTTLDNLASWRMLVPSTPEHHYQEQQLHWLEVERLNHNLGKIHCQAEVSFRLSRYALDGKTALNPPEILSMAGASLRKQGLGKDVTDKLLQALPGVQKEGCDGLISSASFIVHQQAKHACTVCLEFFGQVREAVPAIVEIIDHLEQQSGVMLAGLEHLDERYIKAVRYSTKSNRSELPKMLLVADISGDNPDSVEQAAIAVTEYCEKRQGEGFIATSPEARTRFWAERKRTAAIAAHTNAFKVNEDVVIPLPKLADYSDGIEHMNIEQSILNKIDTVKAVLAYLDSDPQTLHVATDPEAEKVINAKQQRAIALITQVQQRWQYLLEHMDEELLHHPQLLDEHPELQEQREASLFYLLQTHALRVSYRQYIEKPLKEIFPGDQFVELRQSFDEIHADKRASRLFVALHMHAGDGNVHTNIPVNSHDYHMLHTAEILVERIMKLAIDLGGVISGEHGIGITKWQFLDQDKRDAFAAYKESCDPKGYFNRGKLLQGSELEQAYTPSLRLLSQEALILEATALGDLNTEIKDCLRCGKCKPHCTTHVPKANLLYSPRNKILATGLLIEAVLYEEQTRRGIALEHYAALHDVADHCTVCHRCLNPCPVNIDFGDVTVKMREILKAHGKKKTNLGQWLSMQFLNSTHPRVIGTMRLLMIRMGYYAQRTGSWLYHKLTPKTASIPKKTTAKPQMIEQVVHFIDKPLPTGLAHKPLRQLLQLEDERKVPILRNPQKTQENGEAVFYFPGCGSERLFSEIGLASLAMLYHTGVQTVLPPGYLCCGYPQAAGGEQVQGQQISTANRILFHRIANTLNYLDIKTVLVSCGTCMDQLLKYEFEQIFPGCQLLDIHEFLLEKGIALPHQAESPTYLYHDPCHTPMKRHQPTEVASRLLGRKVTLSDRCCGESGTFAVARPDIATQVRSRKLQELSDNIQSLGVQANETVTVLTSCPACQQGLARYRDDVNIRTEYIVVNLAEQILGEHWQKTFVEQVSQEGIEEILL